MIKQRLQAAHALLLAVLERVRWAAPTLIRLTLGTEFILTGWGKVHHLDKVVAYFQSLGIPHPQLQAPFVAGTELVCGSLILIGLLTRFAVVPLTVSMIVALATAKADQLHALSNVVTMIEFLYIVLFVALLFEGAGPISLDALLARWLGFERPPPRETSALQKKAGNAALGVVLAGTLGFVGWWYGASHNPCDRVPHGPFAELVTQSNGPDDDAITQARGTCRQILAWQKEGKDPVAELKKQQADE